MLPLKRLFQWLLGRGGFLLIKSASNTADSGGKYSDDEDFQKAVSLCMERIAGVNPEAYGYRYAPELAPRMQPAPQGWRGYIEMLPVESLA